MESEKWPITYDALEQELKESGRPYDLDMIRHAYQLAEVAHGDQRRRSGEPYICHPLSVAEILVELGMDSESIAAALMHDVAEDTSVSIEQIRSRFGSEVALLVDGVTKLTKINFSNVEDRQAENLRKMLLAMSQDVRVMIIKLCDRLHNMRTGDAWPEQKRRDKAKETMEVYAPIAHRLGMSAIKEELEDRSLHYLDPVGYEDIKKLLNEHGDEFLHGVCHTIAEHLAEKYEPWISDPVKYTYRQFGQGAQVEKQALAGFRQVWLELLPTYWQTYVEAFVANTRGYYCFIPRYTGVTYSMQAGRRFYFGTYTIEGEGQLHTTQPQSLSRLRDLVQSLCERWDTIPLLQILLVSAAYTWLLIGAGIACAQAGRRRDVWLFLPALMSLATCLLSPVDDYFRYFLPIVAMTPLLLCLARHEKNRAQED